MTEFLGPYELGPGGENLGIYTGDARELAKEIPDESVDLIFTDPVYQNIDDYRWLAETAARVLKPDSAALIWYGIGYMPEILDALRAGGLHYRWQGIMWYKNREKPLHCDMGYSLYAGLFWMEKGRMTARRTMDLFGVNVFDPADTIAMSGRSNHTWGKPPFAIKKWVEAFCKENAVVLDPFAGGCTVPAVCKMLGRRWLAFEIVPGVAEDGRERVRLTQPPLFVPQDEQIVLFE